MASGVGISITGLSALSRKLAASAAKADLAMGAAIYQAALSIFAESQRIVPVDTGSLRASGHVRPPTKVTGGTEVEIGYGGAAAGYALYVHEITTSYHAPPTRAKYLEEPMLEAAGHLEATMTANLRGIFGGTP
jgi:hypothetical protein